MVYMSQCLIKHHTSSLDMASSSLLILAVACCFVSLISPAISQTCSSQNLNPARFDTCRYLPVLDSYLHYTYNASNSSLSVAFVATPSRPDGWIAWGINPTGTGMSGSQAFVAYIAGARPVVRTFNITGVTLNEGRLAFDFWNLRAESMSDGRIAIFTTVKAPAGADQLNQVWQIGGNVTNRRVGVHPFKPANMNGKGVLRLTADAPTPAPSTGGSTTPGQARGPGNAGSLASNVNLGVNLGIMVLLGSIFIF